MKLVPFLRVVALVALGLALATPLVVSNWLWFAFIVGKNIFFRVCVEVAFGAWALMGLLDASYRPKCWPILWSVLAFALAVLVADLAGIDPAMSIWSNFERMEGWVGLAHLVAWFVALAGVVRSSREWATLVAVSVGISVIVTLNGFAKGGRIASTLGNSTYLAIYLLFHVFIVLYAVARVCRDGITRAAWWLVGGGALVATYLVAIVMTQTRSTFVAIGASAVAVAVPVALFERSSVKLRQLAIVVVALVAVVGSSLYLARHSAFVHETPVLARAASIFDFGSGTVKGRFENWKVAWDGVKERPVLGWGQENYPYVFALHYNPQMYAQELWWDRSHNVVLDWLVVSGVVGLIAYFSIFGAAVYQLRRSSLPVLEKAILLGAIVGYFVHNLFVFDSLTSSMFFMALLAYLAGPMGEAGDVTRAMPSKARSASLASSQAAAWVLPEAHAGYLAATVALATLGAAYWINVPGYRANLALRRAQTARTVEERLAAFADATSHGFPGRTEAIEQFAFMTQSIRRWAIPQSSKDRFIAAAVAAAESEVLRSPKNLRAWISVAIAHAQHGDLDKAIVALETARELSPRRQFNLFQLGFMYVAANRFDEAVIAFKQAYDAAPEYVDATVNYAAGLIYARRSSDAAALLAGVDLSAKPQYAQTLIGAYFAAKDYRGLTVILEPLAMTNPSDVRTNTSLALAYFMTGQRQASIATLERLAALVNDPAVNTDLTRLIALIKAGKNPMETQRK